MSVCLTPFNVKNPKIQGSTIPVPCGRCPPCFARRTSQWSFRLRVEGRQHMLSSFITLTYDTQSVPLSDNGFLTLKKSDVQNFIKRLRKTNEKKYGIKDTIKYYVAGEYGSHTRRPHYHLIIFNAHPDAISSAWSLDKRPLGFIHIGTVTDASIGYSLKYISKKLTNKKRHSRDDRQKEFQLCSKGIGLSYLTSDMVNWHKNAPADRCFAIIEDNKKISLPRYFRNKIFNESELKQIGDRMEEISIHEEYQQYLKHGNNLESYTHQNIINKINQFNKKQKRNYDSI